MSFATDLVLDGVLRVLALEVSSTSFISLNYAFATVAGVLDGTNQFDARILKVGNVRRGLAQSRIAAAGACEVTIDNTDGAYDAFLDRTNLDSLSALRFRLKMYLVTSSAAATAKAAGTNPTFTSKLLGEYVLAPGWPEEEDGLITLPLADDVMGTLSQAVPLPTLADWAAVGDATDSPLSTGFGRPDVLDREGGVQVPLAFGEDWVQAMPHLLPFGAVDAAYEDKMIVPICCTADTGAFDANEITSVRMQFLDFGKFGANAADPQVRLIDLPRTVASGTVGDPDVEVWSVERSPVITKLGVDFEVIYLVVRSDLGCVNVLNNWLRGQTALPGGQSPPHLAYGSGSSSNEASGGYPLQALYQFREYAGNNPDAPQYANLGSCVLNWFVKGIPLSAITQQTSEVQHPVDVVTDLATYYVQRPLTVSSTMADRVIAGLPLASAAGVVQPWQQNSGGVPPSLRQVLSAIAQSSDFDVFMNWDGQLSFAAQLRDYTTATQFASLPEFTSEHFSTIRQWQPGDGERHSVYNRIYLNGGKPYPAEDRGIPFQGPFDMPNGSGGIEIESRVIETTLEQGWRPWRQQSENPLYWRTGLDTEARPMVRFVTELRAIQLDLGDFFRLTWKRGYGLSARFDDEVFQVEAITYSDSDEVEITAVWQDDTTTDGGYLLDNESFALRSKGGLTGSATDAVGDQTITFGGTINLTTMGVEEGDIIVLLDSTQAADVFTRCGAWRIIAVVSTTEIEVALNGLGAYPAVGVIANADWNIYRGATTYHTAVSDPTNYPDGGAMYGKSTNSGGQYSNASFGLKLLGG